VHFKKKIKVIKSISTDASDETSDQDQGRSSAMACRPGGRRSPKMLIYAYKSKKPTILISEQMENILATNAHYEKINFLLHNISIE
jgi:hypothetical protein